MEYACIQGVAKPVSRLVMGTMVVTVEDAQRSFDLLDAAVAEGYTSFDTAHVYGGGNSERAVGEWMRSRGNRDEVLVIGKGCHPNADRNRVTPFDLAADLHDSLARLKTDYIDLYMLHRDDPTVPVGTVVEALNQELRAGRIRAFGASNWRHERIRDANEYAATHGLVRFAASSPHFSLAEQVDDPWGPGCVALSGPGEQQARDWYVQTQLPVFAYSSLARGFFAGRFTRATFAQARDTLDGACLRAYCHEVNFERLDRVTELARRRNLPVARVAMAYVFSQGLNLFALVGAESREELSENAQALQLELSQEEAAWLDLRRDAP